MTQTTSLGMGSENTYQCEVEIENEKHCGSPELWSLIDVKIVESYTRNRNRKTCLFTVESKPCNCK